nr:hypothetical protein [Tanacetum cinerariifolium]
MNLMLISRLQVEEDSEVARDLVMKILLKANQPKSKKEELETSTSALSFLKLSWSNVSLEVIFLVDSSSLSDLRKQLALFPWKLQRYMHYPIMWKLHPNCRVHQVSSTTRRYDIYMLAEKDYPLSNQVMNLMLSSRLQVEEDSEVARDLEMKILLKANQPKSKTLELMLFKTSRKYTKVVVVVMMKVEQVKLRVVREYVLVEMVKIHVQAMVVVVVVMMKVEQVKLRVVREYVLVEMVKIHVQAMVNLDCSGNIAHNFLENQPNVTGSGPKWLFDIDTLTQFMNYQPVVARNQPNHSVGIKENLDAGTVGKDTVSAQQYVLLPLWSTGSKGSQNTNVDAAFDVKVNENEVHVSPSSSDKIKKHNDKDKREAKGKNMHALEDIVYSDDEDDVGVEADFSNLETSISISPIPTTRVHKDHPISQIIGELTTTPQKRSMERMVLVDLPKGKRAIGSKWVFRNKKDEREIVIRNKARLVTQGHTQEEGMDYEEVFAPVVRIEAIRLFLAYASFMGFKDPDYPDKVYKVVKALYGLHQAPRAWYETLANYLLENGFQRGKIDQTLFIKKQKGDILLVRVYVDDIFLDLPTRNSLQVKQKDDGIFISQDKFVAEILRKFGLTDGKSVSTFIDIEKPLLKDPDGEDVDVHIYKSMIGSLMYLTSSRPDIMFAVYACARFQVTPKVSHLHAVKRIFRYLKGKPNLGLWYPKDSPFNLVAYSNSDYAGASLDMKSTAGGCQFLGCRLISWQCKKQTVVATSLIEAEYVAAASCYAQVLWIQNQLLDYGPKQTALGKDESNPLIVDSLLKTIWSSMHHVIAIKHWLFQGKWKLCMSAKRTAWNEFSSFMASAVICLATETPLFDTMLVQPQVDAKNEDDDEVSTAPTPPSPTPTTTPTSPTHDPLPPPQAPISPPPQAPPALTSSPLQEQSIQPINTIESSMNLLSPLMETCASLTQKVAHLEQDKVVQASEITKLKQRVKKLERKRRTNHSGLKRLRKVGTSRRVESYNDIVVDAQED